METNVKVAVRCRPMSTREQARGCGTIIKTTKTSVHIDPPADNDEHGGAKVAKDFTFDHCYFTESTQDEVYQDLGAPVVKQALDGFNCTIFAYGQTGSGKTHSMMGVPDDDLLSGVVPRLNDDLWNKIRELEEAGAKKVKDSGGEEKAPEYMITVSFLEIYNEEIKDLLNPSSKAMKIRESPDQGIYVQDLCILIVKNKEAVMQLIDQGNTVRRVAATKMNDTSSRSHSVFTLRIEQRTIEELEGGVTKTSLVKAKLNLVDLAGSERADKTGAVGDTLKEGANINMSLMALGNVINALSEMSAHKGKKKTHIPYRDSKLTRLLQESLGGNAATVMLAAISPADYNFDETLSTLKYANRAKSISNAVTKNEDVNQRMIKDLKAEIERLKEQMSHGGGGNSEIDAEAAEAQKKVNEEKAEQIAALEEQQKNDWEERRRLEEKLNEEREANLNVAMSDMMNNVKDKKVEQMKNIKKLQNEKSGTQKRMKDTKAKHAKLKTDVDADMKAYSDMQQKYDAELQAGNEKKPENIQLSLEMAEKLSQIENSRALWVKLKDTMKNDKIRLTDIDEEITEERAELVATAGLLDQNDKLRKQIQEEERARAKDMIETEIAATKAKLEAEQGNVLTEKSEHIDSLEKEISALRLEVKEGAISIKELQSQLSQSEEYTNKMEEKLADAEVGRDEAHKELVVIKEELEKSQETIQQAEKDKVELEALRNQQKEFEEQKYHMFKSMMDEFSVENSSLGIKYAQTQDLLVQASKDVVYLMSTNEKLRKDLNSSLTWE